MKCCLPVIIFLISISGYAQDSSFSNTNQISFKWPNWKMNGHRLKPKELPQELMKVNEAMVYYKKAKTSKIIGLSFCVPTIVFALLGRQNTDIASRQFGKHKAGFLFAGIVSSGTVLFFNSRSVKNLKKAVAAHNENLRTIY